MPSPDFTSAERLNERVEWGRQYYRERLDFYLQAAARDGYVVGTDPPENIEEEFARLTPQVPSFLQIAADEMQPEPLRAQAQQALVRWLVLRRKLAGKVIADRSAET